MSAATHEIIEVPDYEIRGYKQRIAELTALLNVAGYSPGTDPQLIRDNQIDHENRVFELTAEVERLTAENADLRDDLNGTEAGRIVLKNLIEWHRERYKTLEAENQLLFDRANDVRAENERLRTALRPFARAWIENTPESRVGAAEFEQAAEALAPVTAGRDTSMEME